MSPKTSFRTSHPGVQEKLILLRQQTAAAALEVIDAKGWLAIAKLKPLSLFIAILSMPKKAFYDVKI